eukprot:365775-Chlamydomonas_euryale.AAC.13
MIALAKLREDAAADASDDVSAAKAPVYGTGVTVTSTSKKLMAKLQRKEQRRGGGAAGAGAGRGAGYEDIDLLQVWRACAGAARTLQPCRCSLPRPPSLVSACPSLVFCWPSLGPSHILSAFLLVPATPPPRSIHVHLCASPTLNPSINIYMHPPMHSSIYLSIHASVRAPPSIRLSALKAFLRPRRTAPRRLSWAREWSSKLAATAQGRLREGRCRKALHASEAGGSVEGRGRAWKGVEGRGRAWKGVEGCGRACGQGNGKTCHLWRQARGRGTKTATPAPRCRGAKWDPYNLCLHAVQPVRTRVPQGQFRGVLRLGQSRRGCIGVNGDTSTSRPMVT